MTYTLSAEDKEKSKLTKEEWRDYTKTVWSIANTSHEGHPAVFPLEIPHRLTKLFSYYGETVLDPFAGTGTTDFEPLVVVNGDSRRMDFVKADSVGLVVTSPPYWNKADYGDSKKNLGTIERYSDFIEGIRPVFEECYRVLMPGRKLCVVTANVNQHTDHGLLTFPLATDFAVLLRQIGFVMINEIIWSKDGTGGKWGSYGAQRPIFGSYPYPPNFLFKNVHEYILIFAKPPRTKTTGPKAQPYKKLVEGLAGGIMEPDSLPAYAQALRQQ
jgi:DNA modification methylase